MATAAQRRWVLWTPLLIASAYLAFWGDKTPDRSDTPEARAVSEPLVRVPVVRPTSAAEPSPQGSAETAQSAVAVLVPREVLIPSRSRDKPRVDLFAAHSWTPSPVARSDGNVAPVAPPFPYAYVGKKWENGVWEVYLSRDKASFVVRLGDTLEGLYEIVQIAPPVLTVKYKPLGQRQTVEILGIGEFAE